MSAEHSLSIFAIEVDRNPIFAIQCKKHAEAEAVFLDEALLNQLRVLRSGGTPLCDDFSILRVRLARENERALYFENASSLLTGNGHLAVLLVKLDDPS